MKINEEGLKIIKDSEGLSLKSYLCPAKVWTVGYGSTGEHVKPSMTISKARAEELLRTDLKRFENGVSDLLKVKTSSNEFSALVSFAFNLGLGNLKSSTLLREHNKGNKFNACKEFHSWRSASGKVLKGLVLRRLKEAELYIR